MPPKKKSRTSSRAKTKAAKAKKRKSSRGRGVSTRASKRGRQETPKKIKLRRKRVVNTLNEIEREIRNRKLAGAEVGPDRQSDFQGLSRVEEADSESIDELVEEGNATEAGAVAGVQEADSEDEREVHTREVPEDDVPDEYLEQD
jgi:hypothetical protein